MTGVMDWCATLPPLDWSPTMTNPTPDDAQFSDRYLNSKTAVDKLRDAVYVAGPNDPDSEEQFQLLDAVNDAVPTFFYHFAFALGDYVNNQTTDPSEAVLSRLAVLIEKDGKEAMEAAFEAGGSVLGGAINDLGIFLRKTTDPKTGKPFIAWVDKTPDAPIAAE